MAFLFKRLQTLSVQIVLVSLVSCSVIQLSTATTSSSPEIFSSAANSTKSGLQQLLDTINSYDSCTYDITCRYRNGTNSRCYNNRCICDLGYHHVNSFCSRLYCTYDYQCQAYFKNTVCSGSSTGGICVCDSSSELDVNSQTCKPSSKPYCTTSSDCWSRSSYGYNAFCNSSNLCDCEMGYTRQFPSLGCTSYSCIFNSDCSSRWANTECGFSSCNCKADYELNSISQKCYYVGGSGGGGEGGDGTAIGITIIVLVIIVTISSCIAVCSRSSFQQPQPPPQRRVYRQPTASNISNSQQLSAANRRLPMPRLTMPTDASASAYSSQTMDTPPPAYTEAVEGSTTVQVFSSAMGAQPPRYNA